MALGQYHPCMTKKPQQSISRSAEKYIVRFPDGMRERVTESAKKNERTINAEIIFRLNASFAQEMSERERAFYRTIVEQQGSTISDLTTVINTLTTSDDWTGMKELLIQSFERLNDCVTEQLDRGVLAERK
jgi:hypothetical protein